MSNRKLIKCYIDVPEAVDLKWLRKNMENRINAVLYPGEYQIEFEQYENDAMYNARIHRENFERNLKNDPEYQKYLELKKRFENL